MSEDAASLPRGHARCAAGDGDGRPHETDGPAPCPPGRTRSPAAHAGTAPPRPKPQAGISEAPGRVRPRWKRGGAAPLVASSSPRRLLVLRRDRRPRPGRRRVAVVRAAVLGSTPSPPVRAVGHVATGSVGGRWRPAGAAGLPAITTLPSKFREAGPMMFAGAVEIRRPRGCRAGVATGSAVRVLWTLGPPAWFDARSVPRSGVCMAALDRSASGDARWERMSGPVSGRPETPGSPGPGRGRIAVLPGTCCKPAWPRASKSSTSPTRRGSGAT